MLEILKNSVFLLGEYWNVYTDYIHFMYNENEGSMKRHNNTYKSLKTSPASSGFPLHKDPFHMPAA